MSKVYVARCNDYEYKNVHAAISKGINALGGLELLIGDKKNVAVKPNLVKLNKPEDCVTTHPSVVQSVLVAIVESGRNAKIVESPSGAYSASNLKTIYDGTGMTAAAANAGATLNDNFDVAQVYVENGKGVKNLRIIQSILDADSVITVAKLKTHSMMSYTGAVKNLFGVVPGLSKVECHFRLPEKDDFANMIVDVADFVHPDLSVIDAVWAMEGEGPSAGDKRYVGVIIISDSPYAADIVAGRIINLDWQDNPVVKSAVDRGLCDVEAIETMGVPVEDVFVADFVKPEIYDTNILRGRVPKFLDQILNKHLVLYPTFNESKCVGCGICKARCPNEAIELIDAFPKLDRKSCINCFCCHELCPHKAVEIKRPVILKIATKIFK